MNKKSTKYYRNQLLNSCFSGDIESFDFFIKESDGEIDMIDYLGYSIRHLNFDLSEHILKTHKKINGSYDYFYGYKGPLGEHTLSKIKKDKLVIIYKTILNSSKYPMLFRIREKLSSKILDSLWNRDHIKEVIEILRICKKKVRDQFIDGNCNLNDKLFSDRTLNRKKSLIAFKTELDRNLEIDNLLK